VNQSWPLSAAGKTTHSPKKKKEIPVKRLCASLLILIFASPFALADNDGSHGLIQVQSTHSVANTVLRLKQFLAKKKIPVFALINHSAAARQAGLALRPTELLIFGNPTLGSKLMQLRQRVGLDLPLKALIWQDRAGHVWITYHNPRYLATRYGIAPSNPIIRKMTSLLVSLSHDAAGH